MIIKIPVRSEAQFLRVKAAVRDEMSRAAGGQAVPEFEVHCAIIALAEAVLKTGPGIIADDAAPVYEAPPLRVPILPFPPDDHPMFDNLPGRRPDAAKIGAQIAALSRKIDELIDALADKK